MNIWNTRNGAWWLRGVCGVLLALLLPSWPAEVHADLMLYPTRVVLSGRTRSAQVELVNRSALPQTFRISLIDRRMTDTGEIVAASGEGEDPRSARRLLVYTPRQITLLPGEAQTVRVSVRKPAELAKGEYRSHLQFDRLAGAAPSRELDRADASGASEVGDTGDAGEVAVALQTLVGASIPVIVRHGDTAASVSFQDLQLTSLEGGVGTLQFSLLREGTQSVYGDLIASFRSEGLRANRAAIDLGRMNGVAVYVPNASRRASLRLSFPQDALPPRGQLTLQFRERPEAGGRVLAEAALSLR